MNSPFQIGSRFIEAIWYTFACKIVDRAIELYKVDEERAVLLKQKFLKRGEYQVVAE